MFILFNTAVFLFGLIAGSFLNCVIYRLELKEFKKEKKSPFKGRSFCPNCRHILSWQDLVPVFSWLFLKGKCRYCSKKISVQYPLVEIITALLFFFIFRFLNFEISLLFIFWILISCFLIIIFVFDLKHYIIPDRIIYLAIAITLFYQLFITYYQGFGNLNYFISAFIASSFFLVIVLLSRGKWMGGGDVKLAFFMGLFLGFPRITIALFSSFFIGAIIGIILILFKKKGFKSEVPFGPFLIIGTYIALFWGEEIITWYFNILTF